MRTRALPWVVSGNSAGCGKTSSRYSQKINVVLGVANRKSPHEFIEAVANLNDSIYLSSWEHEMLSSLQEIAEAGRGYSSKKYVASFVGFPLNTNRKLISLVSLQEPEPPNIFGGEIAAPVFSDVMGHALARAGVLKNGLATTPLAKKYKDKAVTRKSAISKKTSKIKSLIRRANLTSGNISGKNASAEVSPCQTPLNSCPKIL